MKTGNRLLYLDLMRGLAAVIMLQGHVFHSFIRNDLRTGGPYIFSQFLGGMPPAIFLFLTGITLAFLMDSQERKGVAARQRWVVALRRAGYLLMVAFAFRLQLWVFSRIFSHTNSPWTEMLKVDILNCMGFGIGLLAVMAVFTTRERIRLCAILGCAIALASPLVSQAGLASWPPLLRDYFVPSYNFFSFFPWAAFIAFGLSFGSILRVTKPEQLTQAMQWFALAGIALAMGGGAASSSVATLYAKSEFWLDSPALTMIKLGVLLIGVAFCYVWMMQKSAQGWSWIRQLGTTSLLVYWVHIELVYGNWLGWLKLNLSVGQTVIAAACIIAAMVGLSYANTNWHRWKQALFTPAIPEAPPVPGS
jgi:uncharacterized membrane protein